MRNRIDKLRIGLVVAAGLLLGSGSAIAGSYEDSLDAARLGRTAQLAELLDRGIDPDTVDAFNNSLLIIAARERQFAIVELLLSRGAKVSYRNEAGDSALMLAALKGDEEMVAKLLAAGAEVDHEGWTPLMYAAFEGHLSILERLLAAGSDVNALAPNQANALMFAARNGHVEIVRRLLATDVNLAQQSDRGYTAESWALEYRNTDIAELVRAEQARRAASSRLTLQTR